MNFKEAIEKIDSALQKGSFVCFFCHCAISYSGRAESYLDFGDRFFAIKQDRTIMIHQPEGGMPINYLKAPASCTLTIEEDGSLLVMSGTSGDDEIFVEIKNIYEFFSRKLIDGQKQNLSGNEAEMSDMLRDNPKMVGPDFIPLSREEHTKYGFIDVFGHLGDGRLAIVECKRYTAGLSAVTQLRRYVEKMISAKGLDKDQVTGIMAAPAITANALEMLTDWGLTFVAVIPPMRNVKQRKRQKQIDHFF
jgi:RecB family endonuclease NucS